MPYDFQIAVDASRPHELAGWWAKTLGWVVEPQDEMFIRRMIAEGHASEDDTITHKGALVWRDGAAIRKRRVAGGGANRTRCDIPAQRLAGPALVGDHGRPGGQ